MENHKVQHAVHDDRAARGASGYLTIDLAALADNYRLLAAKVAPAKASAVVKADAYGLGAARVAPILYAAGCRDFFVAHFGEAVPLRPILPADARLFVLNGLQPGNEPAAADAGITPVINSQEQLAAWKAVARDRSARLPAVLQFDTGMSRLGLPPLEDIDLLFIMSHLASADEPGNDQNEAQRAAMTTIAARYPSTTLCFANSGGVFLGASYHGVLVRPGVALYGGAPTAGVANPMKPVVRLDVAVVQTRTVPAGTRVGYGGTFTAKNEMRLATIAAGYADGLHRCLSDRGAVFYNGIRLPIVGRVSMDSMTVDISALPPGTLRLGSLVEVIGPHQTLEDLASAAGTISYEILTSLGRRYHRDYLT
jgi:alanine racemase